MLTLGIESTCDETACSVVRDGKEILSNTIASQIDLHAEYGGVVPELACRCHIDVLIPIIKQALKEANTTLDEIDLISVASGPGLIGAILIGLNAAKTLSLALKKPLVTVNHIEAHLYSSMMDDLEAIKLPSLGIVLSGGHTSLVKINALGNYELIGATVDDAIGEAFDKVAKILGLPYPGGPQIEKLAKNGDPEKFKFRAGTVKKHPLDFSFSGLKTAVLYTVKGDRANKNSPILISEDDKKDVAASFQRAAISDIIKKTKLAIEKHPCKSIIIGGGVSNNKMLRNMFEEAGLNLPIHFPKPLLSTDNAAMIAGLGYAKYKLHGESALDTQAKTRMPFV